MENTTNYGLRKYQTGDLFNPLTVNNPNLDDIDTDMKAISDRTIGRATELVSQGVHAITLLDTDCKTFKFVATGNYSAGETFTVNGIQVNAYTPSGSALVSNAFVTGSIVLGTLNEDGTAITFYVTGSAVADDSLKLGGELPSYYATQSDMTSANTDITNLKNQSGNTSIVGIGDGTLSGAVSSLNNDLIANSNKFKASYSNGKYGFNINNTFYEIGGGNMELDFANAVELAPARSGNLNVTIPGNKLGALYVCTKASGGSGIPLFINGKESGFIPSTNASSVIPFYLYGIRGGSVLTTNAAVEASAPARKITFIPYV